MMRIHFTLTGDIKTFSADQGRALLAVRLFAPRDVLAPMDSESPGRGIEVGL